MAKSPILSSMRKRQSFLLLELLIAFSLLALCMVPLVSSPLSSLHRELDRLEAMEWERLGERCFAEVKESLYNNTLAWDSIPLKKPAKGIATREEQIDLAPFLSRKVVVETFIYWKSPPESLHYVPEIGKVVCELVFHSPAQKRLSKQEQESLQFHQEFLVVRYVGGSSVHAQ